jgi:hypothetical protein
MNRRSFLARLTSSFGLLVSLYGTPGSRVQATTGHTSYWKVTTVRRHGFDPENQGYEDVMASMHGWSTMTSIAPASAHPEQIHSWCYGYHRGEFLMDGLPACERPPHDPTYAARRRAEFNQGWRDAVKEDLRARLSVRSKPLPLP